MGGDGKKNRELVRERRNGMPTRRVNASEGERYTSIAPAHVSAPHSSRPANAKAARNLDGPNHPCIEQRGFCHNPKSCPFTNLKPSVCWMLLKHGSCNGRQNGTCMWDHPRNPMACVQEGMGPRSGTVMAKFASGSGTRPPAEVARRGGPGAAGAGLSNAAFPALGQSGVSDDASDDYSATPDTPAPAPGTPSAVPPQPAAAAAAAAPQPRSAAPEAEQVVVALDINPDAFQRVIGRQGARRREVEERHGVRLHVPPPDAPPDARATVAGPLAAVDAARRELESDHGVRREEDEQQLAQLRVAAGRVAEEARAAEEELNRAGEREQEALKRQQDWKKRHGQLQEQIRTGVERFKGEQDQKEKRLQEIEQQIAELQDSSRQPGVAEADAREEEATVAADELQQLQLRLQVVQEEKREAEREAEESREAAELMASEVASQQQQNIATMSAARVVTSNRETQAKKLGELQRHAENLRQLRDALADSSSVVFRDADGGVHALRRCEAPDGSCSVWLSTLPPQHDDMARNIPIAALSCSGDELVACSPSDFDGDRTEPIEYYRYRLPGGGARGAALRDIGALAGAAGVPFDGPWLPQTHDVARQLRACVGALSDDALRDLWRRQEQADGVLRDEVASRLLHSLPAQHPSAPASVSGPAPMSTSPIPGAAASGASLSGSGAATPTPPASAASASPATGGGGHPEASPSLINQLPLPHAPPGTNLTAALSVATQHPGVTVPFADLLAAGPAAEYPMAAGQAAEAAGGWQPGAVSGAFTPFAAGGAVAGDAGDDPFSLPQPATTGEDVGAGGGTFGAFFDAQQVGFAGPPAPPRYPPAEEVAPYGGVPDGADNGEEEEEEAVT